MTASTLLFGSITTPFISQPHAVEASSDYKQKAIDAGKKVLGTPYKWGGTTISGFDNSSFIDYAFKKQAKCCREQRLKSIAKKKPFQDQIFKKEILYTSKHKKRSIPHRNLLREKQKR
jgi:hypothetical protein